MIHKNRKKEVLAAEHYKTALQIHKVQICYECPLRIYAKKDENIILGIGNIMTDIMIVLPSYDVKAKIGYNTLLKIVQDAYKDICGKELFEDCYVTRAVKCFNKTDFNLEKDAIKSCINNLYYEISYINPKKVIVFDKLLYGIELYNSYRQRIAVKTCISPGVIYYDNQNLKDVFTKQFKKALNDS